MYKLLREVADSRYQPFDDLPEPEQSEILTAIDVLDFAVTLCLDTQLGDHIACWEIDVVCDEEGRLVTDEPTGSLRSGNQEVADACA